MYDKHYIGMDVVSSENNGQYKPVSRVTLMVDDESAITAGDDTGLELVADCPHATQEMVNDLLASLKGYVYQAFNSGAANVDPAAERGDGATIEGMYGLIAQIEDDGSGYSDISGPGEAELEDEYPSAGPMTRELNRKLASTRSSITKTAEQIRLEVSKTYATQAALSATETTLKSSITQTANSIISEVSASYLTKNAASGTYETITNVSKISQKVDSIKLSVSNGTTSSTIKLMAGETEISSQVIKFTGNVLFASDLGANGKTEIDGGRITTGKISADRIDANGLRASSIQGSEIYIRDEDGGIVGWFEVNEADTADYKIDLIVDAMAIVSDPGNLYFSANGSAYLQIKPGRVEIGGGMLRPAQDDFLQIGNSSYRLQEIYCVNDVIQTSDRRRKKNISYGLSRYDSFFDRLKPGSYQMENGKRIHTGLVAQDIEALLEECGIDTMEFAGFVKSEREDGTGFDYGLRYSEFIPLLIEQIQGLKQRVKELEKHGREKTA